eukprot:4256003-Amphidinium_carterae.1
MRHVDTLTNIELLCSLITSVRQFCGHSLYGLRIIQIIASHLLDLRRPLCHVQVPAGCRYARQWQTIQRDGYVLVQIESAQQRCVTVARAQKSLKMNVGKHGSKLRNRKNT